MNGCVSCAVVRAVSGCRLRWNSTSLLFMRQRRSFCAASTQSNKLPLESGEPLREPPADGQEIVSERVRHLVDEIVGLTVLEVAELNTALRKRLNLPETSGMMSGFVAASQAAAAASAASASAEDEASSRVNQKTFFSVKLIKFEESKKIALIKEIRSMIPGINLVQAKKFVESSPAVVKEDLSKTDADELKSKLEKIGATCEVV